MFLRNALDAEHAAIDQFRVEKDILAVNSLGFQRQDNVEIRFGKRIGVHIDVDVDGRRFFTRAQRQRRAWAFKGKILHILCQNVEGRLGGCAIAILRFARGLITHYWYAFLLGD